MKQLEVTIKNILDPPEKMLKMYEAVIGFLHENRDMGSLKVSDITTRAGIGKGTAYEYFSSKEELITSAMMWGIVVKIHELADSISEREGFQEKCFCIFEWLETYKEYIHVMMRIIKGSFGSSCREAQEKIAHSFACPVRRYLFEKIEEMLELGFREGVFSEQDREKRALAFWGAVIQYSFVIMEPREFPFMKLDNIKLKEFVYDSMVKALN